MASSYSGYTTGTFLKAKKKQNNSTGAVLFSSLCALLKSQICCLFPQFATLPPWFCSAPWLWVLQSSGLKPRLSSTFSVHKCLGLGCSEGEVSRGRTARDVSCCFPPLYEWPGIPPAPGSPPAMAGTVSIYPSQFNLEAEGRVQQ